VTNFSRQRKSQGYYILLRRDSLLTKKTLTNSQQRHLSAGTFAVIASWLLAEVNLLVVLRIDSAI